MLSVYLKHRGGKPLKSKVSTLLAGMDASTFKVSDYVTHLGFLSDHVIIITSRWLTIFEGCGDISKPALSKLTRGEDKGESVTQTMSNSKRKKSITGPTLLLALPLHAIVTVETSSDGRNVVFAQGHSACATKYNIKVGSVEMAASIVQRVNHLRAEFRFGF